MNWNLLETIPQLNDIDAQSHSQPVIILKHSTRCSISSTALSRLERNWKDGEDELKLKPYYLDLIAHRDVSNEIERRYQVEHESPQVLVIRSGKCIYSASHSGIMYSEIMTLAVA